MERTVRVVDAGGNIVKTAELKEGERVTFELKKCASLVIADGTFDVVSK